MTGARGFALVAAMLAVFRSGRVLLTLDPKLPLRSLRRVFFAGEPLTDVLVRRFREVFGSATTVVNLYGPTETTLAKCFYRVPAEPSYGVQPIGRPMPETQVLILNRHRGLAGLHEVGEIVIRTPFRSAGYLHNPEANEKVFIQNPFSTEADDLVYLTGDSGRYRSDGSLDILGRIDNQVKIRGVRIEPGEIEATLGLHPKVREVAVVPREDGVGGKLLAGYVVLHTSVPDSAEVIAELRTFLRSRLPEAMVPSMIVLLSALPLNANGKVDRKALPAPDRAAQASVQIAPRNARERELAAIWEEALAIGSVGVSESFYDLGGDSLTAIRVMIRMRALGLDEDVCRGLLQGRTIAEIAGQLDGNAPTLDVSPREHMRLLLNVLRAFLVVLIYVNHFMPSIARRVPFVQAHARYLEPLFNWGTPGFAVAFGITLGFVYLPQYRLEPKRALSLLYRGASIVGVCAAVLALVRLGSAQLPTAIGPRVNPLVHAPIYYALALSTAGVWMRWIVRARSTALAALALAAAALLVQLGLQRLSSSQALPGPGVLLLGKYGYFGMSAGALVGLAIGDELKRRMSVPRWFVAAGLLSMLAGFALSLTEDLRLAWLTESESPVLWRWAFYGGLSMLTLWALDWLLTALRERESAQLGLRLASVVGQLSLPLFLLHFLAVDLGNVCTTLGASQPERFAIEFGSLALVSYTLARKTYTLFYGGQSKRPALAPAQLDGKTLS